MLAFILALGLAQAPASHARPAAVVSAQPVSPSVDGHGAPSLTIPRIDAQATIDGQLDEPAWAQATRLTGFSEYRPVDSQPASERTEILLWYSPNALHIGVLAYDSQPGSIRATVADRDTLDRDDSVRIYLDTFNDKRRAFLFGVNPLGIQEDGVHTEGAFNAGKMFSMNGSVDLSPDYQFDSKGHLTPDGYIVEIRIPFKSLRYSGRQPMTWGINILRKSQRTGREDTWTDAKRIASFLGQAGTIEGLHDLERGVVTEVQPFVTGSSNGTRQSDGRFDRSSVDVSPGVNVRLGFTNVSLDATVNPDFSQVESDASQVSVNERFALYYTEKRPFFLEGIELFATPNQLVYTRRIANPKGGGKFTGKIGKTGIAILSALDDEGSEDAFVTIARVRRDLGENSLAGVTYTDRTVDGEYNRVVAADARIVFGKLYYVLGQVGGSWSGTDSTALSAPMWQAEFDRTARRWGFNYKLTGYGEDFDAQSGYVPRSGIVEGRASNRLTHYGTRGAVVESVSVFFGPNRIWRYDGFGSERAIEGGESANFSGTLRGGWTLASKVGRDFVVFDRDDFVSYRVRGAGGTAAAMVPLDDVSNWGGTHSVTTPSFQKMNAKLEIKHGGVAIFAEGSKGHELRATATLGVRPTTSIRAEGTLVMSRLERERDGEEFARTFIPRMKLEYQPRRSLFFRMIAEYRSERRAALEDPRTGASVWSGENIVGVQNTHKWQVDWLASFEPTPGTVAFFGYGSTMVRDEDLYRTRAYRRTADGFFVKLAYTLRR